MVDVVDQNLFVGLDLEILVVTTDLAEGKELDNLVAARAVSRVELVVAIMQPKVLLEINLTRVSLSSNLEAVKHSSSNVQDVVGVARRQLMVSLKHTGHNLVVELLGDQVHLKLLLERQVLSNGGHGTLGLEKRVGDLCLHFYFRKQL